MLKKMMAFPQPSSTKMSARSRTSKKTSTEDIIEENTENINIEEA